MATDSTPAPSAATAVPAKPIVKPKKKRRFLKFALVCFILLIVFVLLLPTIVSSGPGTNFVLSFVNKSIPGKIEIKDLSVGWFSGTKVEGLTIKDPEGASFIVASVDAPDIALLALVRGNLALGTVTVNASQCDIVQYEDGTTNLDRTLGTLEESKPKDETPGQMPANLSAKLRLTAKEITYSAPQMDKAIVSGLDVQADVDSPQSISALIKAKVMQGKNSGTIDGNAKITDAFDADGKMQMSKANVDATITLANLPTAMIGAMAKQGDKVTALVGPEVTTKITAKGKLSDLTAQLSAQAERLKVDLTTQVAISDDFKQQSVKPVKGQLAWLKITPESHAALMKNADASAGKLLEPFEVTITHENIAVTNSESGPDLLTATAAMNIAVTPIRIDTGTAGKSDIKELIITDMRIAYDGPKGVATALIQAVAKQGDKSGSFIVKADLNKPFDAKGNIDYKTLDGTIDGQIKDFAMGVVDDLIGTQGLLASVLGDKLNATALVKVKPTADGKGGSGTITLTANSPQKLDINIQAKIIADPIANPVKDGPAFNASASLVEPGTVKLIGAQRTLSELSKRYPQLQTLADKLKADESADITLTITELSAPLDDTLKQKAIAKMAVNVGSASFDLNPPGESNPDLLVKLTGVTAGLDYSGPKNQAIATANIATMVAGKPGKVTASATVNNLFNSQGELVATALAPVVVADVIDLPTALADAFINKGRLAHYGIGPVLNAKVTTTITQVAGSDGKTTMQGPVLLTAKAENLDVVIDGRLRNDRFELPEPAKSHVTMIATPALLEDMKKSTLKLPEDFKNIALDQPAKLHITFAQLDVPLDAVEAKKSGRFGLTMAIDQITPKGDARLQGASVRNLVATLVPTTLEQPVIVTIKGDLVQGASIGKIDVTANVTNALKDDRSIAANATITNIPTPLIDALGGQGGLLVDLFGNTIERVALSMKPGEGNAMIAGYDIKSQLATGQGGITLVPEKSATASPNSKLNVNLSPQGFAAIQRKYGDTLPAMLKDVVLVEPTIVDITIERAQFALAPLPAEAAPSTTNTTKPTFNQATNNAAGSSAAATVEPAKPLPINAKNSSFKVSIKTKGPFIGKKDFESALRMENVNLDIHTPQNMSEIAISMKADTAVIPMVGNAPQLANAGAIERGQLSAQITAKNLADKNGRVSFEGLGLNSLVVNVKGEKLPVAAVDKLLAMEGKITGILGATVDEVTVITRKDGDLVARLKSSNADINVTGLYTDKLSLTDNAVADLHMNEILSNMLFEPLTGGILRAEKSEKPVHIVVQKEGFSAPAGDFDIAKLNAKVDFDFNSMKLKPLISVDSLVPAEFKPLMAAAGVGGMLESELGEFLGKFDKHLPVFNTFSASIENGMLTYSKPMTFTIDKYTVALDGKVDLKTKVPQMALGFPKAALSSKLQKFLGSEGFLYVPFTQQNGKMVPDISKFAQTTLKSAFSPANLIPGIGGIPGVGGKDNGGKPDLGSILGGILGGKDDKKNGKKMDEKKKDEPAPKQPVPTPPVPTPPVPTPPTVPAPPTKTPEKTPTPPVPVPPMKTPEKAPEKTPEKTPPSVPAPPTKTPETPPVPPVVPPAKTPEKEPTPAVPAKPEAAADTIKKEVAAIIELSDDRKKCLKKIEEVGKTPNVTSVYILADAMHQLPGGKPNIVRLNTSDPKWAAYEELKRVVISSAFDKLCNTYLIAAAAGRGTDEAHAAIVSWIKENEAKLVWKKDRFSVEK